MDQPTISVLELVKPFLREQPPWVVLSVLAGLVSASAFFLFAGRGFRSLPTYLLLGVMIAPLCQLALFNLALTPGRLTVGEVDLGLLVVGTWLPLSIARLLRL